MGRWPALLICKEVIMSKKITDRVWEMAQSFLGELGLEVYDAVYVKEGNDKILRLYIDKIEEGYVGINECEEVSMRLSAMLDENDFIPEAYVLEVSSPGIERVIKYDRHFEKSRGKTVDVRLYSPIDGKKLLTGELVSGGEKENVVISADGSELEIERQKIAEIKIHFEF